MTTRLRPLRTMRTAAAALLLALSVGLLAACSGDDEQQQQQAPAAAQPQQQQAMQQQVQQAPAQPQQQQQQQQAMMFEGEPIKIGYLADYTGPLAEYGATIETGAQLAVAHLNAAGGVLGREVVLVTGDTALDATQASEEARRLIEVEGVVAIVGPLASSITIGVAESIAGDAGVPLISPSATSPQLTIADDHDFLFRSTTSDAAQGPVLAQLAADHGYQHVGVLYINDPYGQGLAESFASAWGGTANLIAITDGQPSYLAELQQAAAGGAEALIAISFPTAAEVYLREALEQGLFDEFLFVDGTRSLELVDAIGAEYLEGMQGTAPGPGAESASLAAFNAAYIDAHGELSSLPYVGEAYDAALAVGLAIEAAGSDDPTAIRDHLRAVGGPGGEAAIAGADGVAAALATLRSGGEVNLQGAVTSLDWDEHGDVTTGFIQTWQFTNGEIENLSVTAFDLSGGPIVAMPAERDDETEMIVSDEPLKIGLLADFSGAIAEFGPATLSGVELAVKQINEAGGILGHPVEVVIGDTALDSTQAVEEARRMIEVEGVHAIVGPLASSITLAVVESVAADAGIPVISPSATSPQLSIADDNDFLFRSTVSDAAQGPVLGDLVTRLGYETVGVLYINDAYGQGLADAFDANYDGDANIVAFTGGQPTYLAELQQAAADGAEALVAISFPPDAEVFLREALEQGLFNTFVFVDGTKSDDLIGAIGEYIEGMPGTAAVPGPETQAIVDYNAAYEAEYGGLSPLPYVAESYDAALAVMLAAQAAGSTDPAAIRDALRHVANPPGDLYAGGGSGVADALAALLRGDDIDLQGAATSLDWDENGDIGSGYIGIWEYQDGQIVELEAIPFSIDD